MHEVPDADRTQLLYLSQLDVQLAAFMRRRKSLIADLATRLLLESGVVVNDSYFFDSEEIANDLPKGTESWIWQGLHEGLIIPAFRQEGVNSFRENWESSNLASMVGILPNSDATVNMLDGALTGKDSPRITWPNRVGVSFGELMNHQFTRESIDSDLWNVGGPSKSRLWTQTRDMRIKYLELGWRQERDPDLHGLRRGSIFKAMADDVGFNGDPGDTVGIIECADKDVRSALRATILWVDELYHFNHADRFRVCSSFPVSTGPGATMMPGLLWAGPSRAQDSAQELIYGPYSVAWPSSAALRQASVDTLLKIRTDEAGRHYEASLRQFREDPSPATWDAYKVRIKAYAQSICKAVGGEVRSGLDVRHFVMLAGLSMGTAVAVLVGDVAPGGVPVHTVSVVVPAVATLYTSTDTLVRAAMARREVHLSIGGTEAGNVQMDLPARGKPKKS